MLAAVTSKAAQLSNETPAGLRAAMFAAQSAYSASPPGALTVYPAGVRWQV
jgi:hypothetical protein